MSEMIQQSLESALQHHQAGRLQEAQIIYRQILTLNPEHPDALHLLGAIALKVGKFNEAIALIQAAIRSNPTAPHYYSNLGRALALSDRSSEAIEAFRHAVALNPDLPDIHVNIGSLLQWKGDVEGAIASYKQAITFKPNYAEAHNCLGNAHQVRSEFDLAVQAYRRALEIRPDYIEAHNNLGCALRMTGKLDEAIAEFQVALRGKPNAERFAIHLAETLKQAGQVDAAREAYRHVFSLNPSEPETNSSLGEWLSSQGDHDQAIAACRKALQARPNFEQAWINLGNALKAKLQLDEAADAYRRAIAIRSDNAVAHFNLAIVLLMQGNFAEGLKEYEWRWRARHRGDGKNLALPTWDGTDLTNRRVLLFTEQGFGDSIQLARYIPLISQQTGATGKVYLQCDAEVAPLLAGMEGIEKIIAADDPAPESDIQIPLPSLPLLLHTDLQTIPSSIPYLRAEPQRLEKWKAKIGSQSRRKIGLAWAGAREHWDDQNRSMNLAKLEALARVEGVQFYSLQKGPAAQQAKQTAPGLSLIDWTDDLHDFADTAALIENLDLVISVDTAVAHLAGAMGKPVWIMLPFVPDWRWMLNRADSPWYPTMKLFRQTVAGDWQDPIRRIVEALSEFKPS